MLKNFSFLLLFLFFTTGNAQKKQLSVNAEISVLTIAAGPDLNNAFGHSAFRIKDNDFDVIFDYGRFDFNAPNFYLNFVKGKLNYALGSNNFIDFLNYYTQENRSVKEQVLNLTGPEKQRVFNFLLNNYKPENRNYLYEFFFDNCATKIRDVLQETLNHKVTFNPSKTFKNKSFRQLIHGNLIRNSWSCFGIDLALGAVIDKRATVNEHLFLPKYVHAFFKKATIKGSNKNLVKQSHTLNKVNTRVSSNNIITSPLVVFSIMGLIIIYISYINFKTNTRSRWLDIAIFSITGFVGIIILLLWFATNHLGTHNNYNLLWAFAGNVLVLNQVFKPKPSIWFMGYLKLLAIMLCLLTVHWISGVQIYAVGLAPLLIALFIRYLFLIKFYNSKVK